VEKETASQFGTLCESGANEVATVGRPAESVGAMSHHNLNLTARVSAIHGLCLALDGCPTSVLLVSPSHV